MIVQNRMKIVENFQIFCAEYVGMIRTKIPCIHKLRDLILDVGNEKKELLRIRRLHDQDDMLYRCEETGELVNTGNYIRTANLLSQNDIQLERQKREYNRKERICKLNGKPTIEFINDSEETFETEIESDVDLAEYELDRIQVKQMEYIDESKQVMNDVKIELVEISNVIDQFRLLRRIDVEKYKSAYIAFSLPGMYCMTNCFIVLECDQTCTGSFTCDFPSEILFILILYTS